jgi:hypothetical protein
VSAYDNDPRVQYYDDDPGIFVVRLGPGRLAGSHREGRVQPTSDGSRFEAFAWGWEPVKEEFDTADEAIRSLIGDPQ